jgi:hypothetical protein
LRDRLGGWSAERRLSLRITTASVLAFVLAHACALPQGYWAVLSAVFVTQASVGGTLKAAIDRLISTLGGAACGVLVIGEIREQHKTQALPGEATARVQPGFRARAVAARSAGPGGPDDRARSRSTGSRYTSREVELQMTTD